VYVEKDNWARDNAQLVEKVVRLVRLVGREPATPAQTRGLLKLGRKNSF
jgi:uncharacterized protein (DUF849 family)